MSYHFLLDLALILLSTKILGLIAQKFQMPQVVGALIAGLLLSPAGLGLLSETEFTKQLSELGVIVLMFSAGMGTDVNELKHSGKAGFMVAVLGVIVPFLMGTALAWGADELGLIESTGFIENIFIGTILTATSVSITVEGDEKARDQGGQHDSGRRAHRRCARPDRPDARLQPCRR